MPPDTHLDDSPNKLLKPEPKVLDDDDNVDEPTELGEGTPRPTLLMWSLKEIQEGVAD